jgi:hypothetical protein
LQKKQAEYIRNHSLTVVARFGAMRVSKRFHKTPSNLKRRAKLRRTIAGC